MGLAHKVVFRLSTGPEDLNLQQLVDFLGKASLTGFAQKVPQKLHRVTPILDIWLEGDFNQKVGLSTVIGLATYSLD